jgi:ATP-dependent RNA circularization protein (DNA/RNA ligase family)
MPRDDKLLATKDVNELLSGEVVIEEKIDGANIGLSVSEEGSLQVQNRGQMLSPPLTGQFARLEDWLSRHRDTLTRLIEPTCILFGEWSAARHTIFYDQLPDWFLLFDVFDRREGRFWSTTRRDTLAKAVGLASVPIIRRGHFSLPDLLNILKVDRSRFTNGAMEGIIVRRETTDWCTHRAKLVRPDFTQAITDHWSRRRIEWNRIDWAQSP